MSTNYSYNAQYAAQQHLHQQFQPQPQQQQYSGYHQQQQQYNAQATASRAYAGYGDRSMPRSDSASANKGHGPSAVAGAKGAFQKAAKTALNATERREFLKKNKLHVIMYSLCAIAFLSVYHLLSDGDFSFMLTLGGMTRTFGFGMLAFNINKGRSAEGISLKTLQLYALTFTARLLSILFFDGYLPYDASGDWFYQTNEVVGLGLVLLCCHLVGSTYKSTYSADHDSFGASKGVPAEHGALVWLAAPALLVALVFHPSLNQFFPCDVAWAFALYLESVAVMPQLYVFQRKGGEIQTSTAHYVFAFGLSRLFIFIFWVSSAHELNTTASVHSGWVGTVVLLMQVVHLVLMGDYSYYYLKALAKSIKTGGAFILPTSTMMV